MTKRQHNRYKMFRNVQYVCEEHTSVWSGMPAFVSAFNQLNAHVNNIDVLVITQEQYAKGYTVARTEMRRELANKASQVAASLVAYASVTGGLVLREKIDFTFTDIFFATDMDAENRSGVILEEAKIHAAQLVDYGIDSGTITLLELTLDDFKMIVRNKMYAHEKGQTSTKLLAEKLSETNKLLRKVMDKLILSFRHTHFEFYLNYKHARKVYNYLGRINRRNSDDASGSETSTG